MDEGNDQPVGASRALRCADNLGMVERKRHFAKAVTYRVFGSVATGLVAYAFSHSVEIGAQVGLADSVIKVGLYYVHERVWYRVKWGVRPGARRD